MSKQFKHIYFTTGVIGGVALSYRELMRPPNKGYINFAVRCVCGWGIGAAACYNVPVLAPIIMIGVMYEDYQRRRRD